LAHARNVNGTVLSTVLSLHGQACVLVGTPRSAGLAMLHERRNRRPTDGAALHVYPEQTTDRAAAADRPPTERARNSR